MDFNHGTELLQLCAEQGLSISQVMKIRETEISQMRGEEVEVKMRKALEIMKNSVKEPLIQPVKSVGGLIGGEAKKLEEHRRMGKSIRPGGQCLYGCDCSCTDCRFFRSGAGGTSGSAGRISAER